MAPEHDSTRVPSYDIEVRLSALDWANRNSVLLPVIAASSGLFLNVASSRTLPNYRTLLFILSDFV